MSGTPAVAVALGVFVAYLALVAVLWRVNDVRYDRLTDSRQTIVAGIVVPIGLGAVLLAIATTWLGWWRPALFDDERSGPWWALVVPVLVAAVAIIAIGGIDWRSPQARTLLPVLAVGVLLVGFAEELLCRGLLVVGAADSGWGPWAVFVLSTGLFALLHGMNAFFGQSLRMTLVQIVMAFVVGAALYVTRLSIGTLLVPMLLHALWDFGTLGTLATRSKPATATPVAVLACYAATVVAVPFVVSA